MISVIAPFKLPQSITGECARAIFLGTAPKDKGMRGLIRKYYILSQDGGTAGGIQLIFGSPVRMPIGSNQKALGPSRAKNAERRRLLTCFDSPVVVDTATQEIASDV